MLQSYQANRALCCQLPDYGSLDIISAQFSWQHNALFARYDCNKDMGGLSNKLCPICSVRLVRQKKPLANHNITKTRLDLVQVHQQGSRFNIFLPG